MIFQTLTSPRSIEHFFKLIINRNFMKISKHSRDQYFMNRIEKLFPIFFNTSVCCANKLGDLSIQPKHTPPDTLPMCSLTKVVVCSNQVPRKGVQPVRRIGACERLKGPGI